MSEENVILLPGVQPRRFANESALKLLQELTNQLESGEIVGIGLVTMKSNGTTQCYWDCPTNMGELLYYGVSKLFYRMMKDSNG